MLVQKGSLLCADIIVMPTAGQIMKRENRLQINIGLGEMTTKPDPKVAMSAA